MGAVMGAAVWVAEESAPAAGGGSPGFWAILVVGVLVVAAVLALVVIAKYLRIGINLFLDTPLPLTATLQDYTPPEGEIITFPSLEGRSLRGLFMDRPAGLPDRGTVVFCHEFGSDMMSAGRYAWPLVAAGYTVFTFDFRGHGRSFTSPHYEPRYWPSSHEVNDILAAIALVESRRDVDRRGVGLLGVSRGASAAAMAAAIQPAVRCLALDGVFSTDYSIDELMKRWAHIFARVDLARADRTASVYRGFRALMIFYVELKCRCRFPSARRALTKLDAVPVLFIQGERDTYVLPEQTRVLVDLKPGDKELWVCPGAKHNQAVATDPKTYALKLTEFFNRCLATEVRENDRPPGA